VRKILVMLLAAVATAGCSSQTPVTVTAAASTTTTAAAPAPTTPAQPVALATPEPAPTTPSRTAPAEKTAATKKPARGPKKSCEPHAPARVVGNVIVNKACSGRDAAKAKARGEYATSGDAQSDWQRQQDPGQAALQACREQTGMSTADCIADARTGNAN
jgi:hypothetical protein